MERKFPHRIEYENGSASIGEVIENLKAQKKLLEEGVKFLDAALKNFEVDDVKIRVLKVGSGSLITEFLILVYGTYQTDIHDAVAGGVEEMFGAHIPPDYEPIVTLATLAVTYFVARYAYDAVRAKRPDRPPSVHIDGDYNAVVNTVAERLALPFSEVESALYSTVPVARRRQLVRSVTKFLRPRDDGRPTGIKIDGYGELRSETIDEYPIDSELQEIDDSRNVDISNAILDIRATDKDRNNSGWAAVIIGDRRFKRRMPMDLYPTVDAIALAKLERVVGDIVVEGERNTAGVFKGKRIHLISVKELDQTDADTPKGSGEA
ncbi:hypothetical protein [Mesorhizobium sp. M0140]|uniref:hypothetical protein n=1 Tax=Mesorhizobium sp. M0140 TaxID=2956893 RepID=UPI003338A8D2